MSEAKSMSPLATVPIGREILGRKENAQRMVIHVPEWGGEVLVRQLSARQVAQLRTLAMDAVDIGKQQVRDQAKLSRFNFALIRDSWIDDNGEPVLTDADYDTLLNEPNSVVTVLVSELSEFNRLDPSAVANAKKNSAAIQSNGNGTS